MEYRLSGVENRFMNSAREKADKAFKELQELSRDAGLPVYCSAKHNADQLNTARAALLYETYIAESAKYDVLTELFSEYANGERRGRLVNAE